MVICWKVKILTMYYMSSECQALSLCVVSMRLGTHMRSTWHINVYSHGRIKRTSIFKKKGQAAVHRGELKKYVFRIRRACRPNRNKWENIWEGFGTLLYIIYNTINGYQVYTIPLIYSMIHTLKRKQRRLRTCILNTRLGTTHDECLFTVYAAEQNVRYPPTPSPVLKTTM